MAEIRVTFEGTTIRVRLDRFEEAIVGLIRSVPGHHFNASTYEWELPIEAIEISEVKQLLATAPEWTAGDPSPCTKALWKLADLCKTAEVVYSKGQLWLRVSHYNAGAIEKDFNIKYVEGELVRFSPYEFARLQGAGWKLNPTPEVGDYLTWGANLAMLKTIPISPDAPPLMPHQETGVLEFLLPRRHALLADDPGTGKTVTTVAGFNWLRASLGDKFKALVVCPSAVRTQWKGAVVKFGVDLTPCVVKGTTEKRRLAYERLVSGEANVLVVGYDVLWREPDRSMTIHPGFDWSVIVADEVHRVKHEGARRSEALLRIARTYPNALRWGLSGTPFQNDLAELHSVLRFVDPDVLGPFKAFAERHLVYEMREMPGRGFGSNRRVSVLVGHKNVEEVTEALEGTVLRRTLAEVAGHLPPVIRQDRWLEMTAAQANVYESYRLQAKNLFTTAAREGNNLLTLLLRMRRVCDSPLVESEGSDPGAKLKELAEMFPEFVADGHKCVLFTQWVDMATQVRDLLQRAGVGCAAYTGDLSDTERERVLAEFQTKPEQQALVCTAAGGEGLNLQMADRAIILDEPYNPSTLMQWVRRLERIGQQGVHPILVVTLLMEGTIEERVRSVLRSRRALTSSVTGEGTGEPHFTLDEVKTMLGVEEGDHGKSE